MNSHALHLDAPANGTLADVAAFLKRSMKTVRRWRAAGNLGSSKIGRGVLILEADAVRLILEKQLSELAPAERLIEAQQAWRAFMKVRSAEFGIRSDHQEDGGHRPPLQTDVEIALRNELNKVKDRIDSLEARFQTILQKEAA